MPRKQQEEEAPTQGDFGTPEARRQAFHVVEQPDPNDRSTRRVRIEQQDMIDWYRKRAYLDQAQADALHKWQADAYLAGLFPPMIGNYQQSISGGMSEVSDVRMAAQKRRDHALSHLAGLGSDAIPIVEAVAVSGQSAGRYMLQRNGMSPNEALKLLVQCAVSLARHYGLMK